jgi:ketosteroid isomerase-like protein
MSYDSPVSLREGLRKLDVFANLEHGSDTMIRRLLLFALSAVAVLGLAKYAVRSAAAEGDLKDEILKVDEERNQALQKGDVAFLSSLYSDDLVFTNARGEVLTKAQHLAELKARKLAFQSFKHSDVQVRIHGNTGILTGLSTSAVVNNGTVSSSPRRFLNLYVKEDGRWRCAGHFETPVAQ